MTDTLSGLRRSLQEIVEVRFWEIHLLQSRSNLYRTLRTYALDRGPYRGSTTDFQRVILRFLKYDWDRTIEGLLTENKVPGETLRTYEADVIQEMRKKKIYIAEDDLNILFALDTMLEDAGYDVLLSHCGNPMLEPNLPATDLFILDNRMPDVNGVDIVHHLKQQPATQNIPVIMISAFRHFARQARQAGVDDFLEKPFQMQDLLQLVTKHTTKNNERV